MVKLRGCYLEGIEIFMKVLNAYFLRNAVNPSIKKDTYNIMVEVNKIERSKIKGGKA